MDLEFKKSRTYNDYKFLKKEGHGFKRKCRYQCVSDGICECSLLNFKSTKKFKRTYKKELAR